MRLIANYPGTIGSDLASADGDRWGHIDGWGWGMAIFGWLFTVLVVVLVVRVFWSTISPADPGGRARSRIADLLDERYARGELDRDEYLERRADLER